MFGNKNNQTTNSNDNNRPPYVVKQVVLDEPYQGLESGSQILLDLETTINRQVEHGYRLHTMSTSTFEDDTGFCHFLLCVTLVFERLDMR